MTDSKSVEFDVLYAEVHDSREVAWIEDVGADIDYAEFDDIAELRRVVEDVVEQEVYSFTSS